ncbi:MAG: LysR family transcriptional regulator [Deltaproteobacteria bacterium]|nr:LysR family transcriptional regulator [Deltaproteobacteria bacterium]
MKLNQLEIFCKIIELGSFSKAAEALHLSQPTLTEHMKSLEDELGLILLDRLGKKIHSTKAGTILREYAQRILRLTREAEQKLRSIQGELKGDLTIGASTIPGEYILPPIIKRFRDDFPGIYVHLTIGDTKRIIDDTINCQVELGVVGAKVESMKLDYYPFVKDELVLAMPSGSPWGKAKSVSMDDLTKIPFILREEGSGTRMIMEKALRDSGFAGARLNVVMTLGSTAAIVQAMKSGAGCSIVSRKAVQDYLHNDVIRTKPIAGITFSREFFIILRRGKVKSPLCEALFTFLLENARTASLQRPGDA